MTRSRALASIVALISGALVLSCSPAPASPAPAATAVPPVQAAPAAPASVAAPPAAPTVAAPRPTGQTAEPVEITHATTPGTDYGFLAMSELGLDRKYGVRIKLVPFADHNLVNPAIAEQQIEIGGGGIAPMALFRSQGKRTVVFFPKETPNNYILVKNDSPIQTVADLKGKRFGLFGGPAGQTTLLCRAASRAAAGFDLQHDTQSQFGAPPLLAGLLGKGELDAMVGYQPTVAQLLASGEYRTIGECGQIYKQATGKNPAYAAAMFTTEDVVQKRGPALTRMLQGYIEAIKFLKTPESLPVWEKFAAGLKLDPKTVAPLLLKTYAPTLQTEWNEPLKQEQIDAMRGMIELNPDFLPSLPDGLFTTALVPK